MSKDQGNSPTRYYVEELDRGADGLNWAIYERRPHGSTVIALCYTGEMARELMRLLEEAAPKTEPKAQGQDDLQA